MAGKKISVAVIKLIKNTWPIMDFCFVSVMLFLSLSFRMHLLY